MNWKMAFRLNGWPALGNFVLDFFHTDDSRYEQAGRDRRDRHHDGVGQKIEEIKELHLITVMSASGPYPRQESVPRKIMTTVIKTVAFSGSSAAHPSKVDTALSVRAMELCDRRKQDEEKRTGSLCLFRIPCPQIPSEV